MPADQEGAGRRLWAAKVAKVVAASGGSSRRHARPVDIDADRRTAKVGAGVRWADVIGAAAPHGLTGVSGSSSSVGVVGYSLGGGMGSLGRQYGFGADQVLSVGLVRHNGPDAEGAELLAPMLEAGDVLLSGVGALPYTQADAIHQDPTDPLPVWEKGGLLHELSVEGVEALLAVAGPGANTLLTMVECG